MQKEDAFNATKVMCTMYGGFFKDVAGEVGSEKVLALHAEQGEQFGAILAGAWDRNDERVLMWLALGGSPAVGGLIADGWQMAAEQSLTNRLGSVDWFRPAHGRPPAHREGLAMLRDSSPVGRGPPTRQRQTKRPRR